MALMTTASGGLSGQYQKYFSKKLLPHAKQQLVLEQFGQKTPLPKNSGSNVIRFTRPDVAVASNVQSLSEGVPINVFRDTTLTFIDATLAQWGEAIKVSDVLNWTDLFRTLDIGMNSMGEDVALHADGQIRDELVGAVTGALNRRYVGTTQTFAGLAALSAADGTITITDILDGMTRLTKTRAPKINGEYVLVSGPEVKRDVLNDPKVVLAGQYGTTKSLMNGEFGRWYGVRCLETTNNFIEDGDGSQGAYVVPADPAKAIYRSFILGEGMFGIPLMAGGSPFSPSIMICDKPDKSDPANQFVTAAMKMYWVVKTLNALWAVSISSKSTFVG
jgi:N4-gp56 family major capsid protein